MRIPLRRLVPSLYLLAVSAACVSAADGVWTDPDDPKLPKDYAVQGEYVGRGVGVQVIALADGKFQAVVHKGGLPGGGWDKQTKALFDGTLQGDDVLFAPTTGNRKYLAQKPAEFSAVDKFPPTGQDEYEALRLEDDTLTVVAADGTVLKAEKTVRKSPTLGRKPIEGSVTLFNGIPENMNFWNGGRYDDDTKLLNTDGKDITTKDPYDDYEMHLEFLLPYRPQGRGQGRGNSGFYQVDHYEVQILDSFGLAGKDNECGGVYTLRAPSVNMCLPPLVWQTYDAVFTNARTDEKGKVTAPARLTLKHNGVVVHDDVPLASKTGGSRDGAVGTPGPIKLQGHGNPLQFRNVWLRPHARTEG